ncbi:cyclin-H isoform X2 [Mycteria americana]|uniref:cyclin-H isoform X2 n=1 Tax=Mycteria americana TaxID=33587 RepID=UPI003F585A0F
MRLECSSRLPLHALWSQTLYFRTGLCRVRVPDQTHQVTVLENACFRADGIRISLEVWHQQTEGTACMYFKRFYLNNSVMEYHPRIIMLTCAFLACKVDEFNVSSAQFVGNLRESPLGQEKALEQILEYELLLIQQLNFHLIVHNPYRPFEGFLIDLKTRYPILENPEVLRKTADDFLSRVALTDAYLLFSPSQIALTAILSSGSRAGINMESYLSECLMLKENRTSLAKLLDCMKCMKNLIKKYELPRPEEVAALKQKLEKCHSLELSLNTNPKKRKGYEDDEYVTKKSKMDEEEWTDDDLVDSV